MEGDEMISDEPEDQAFRLPSGVHLELRGCVSALHLF